VKKKELLQLIFKKVLVADGTITLTELYEPFQTFYNEVLTELNVKSDSELLVRCANECIVAHTAAR